MLNPSEALFSADLIQRAVGILSVYFAFLGLADYLSLIQTLVFFQNLLVKLDMNHFCGYGVCLYEAFVNLTSVTTTIQPSDDSTSYLNKTTTNTTVP